MSEPLLSFVVTSIRGLTDPYTGSIPVSRVIDYGHTFRWVRGDRYVAVMRGACVDTHRVLIIRDTLVGQRVLSGPQPLVDAIAVDTADWNDGTALRRIADAWAAGRNLAGNGARHAL